MAFYKKKEFLYFPFFFKKIKYYYFFSNSIMLRNQFDKYEILEETLGKGGFGSVMLARHRFTKEEVAIKIERQNVDGDETQSTLAHECRVLMRLSGVDGVCEMRHFGRIPREENARYLVMSRYFPVPWKSYVDMSMLDVSREIVAGVLRDVKAALESVHGRGILHNDVKRANILMKSTGGGVLCDFGLACAYFSDRDGFSGLEEKCCGACEVGANACPLTGERCRSRRCDFLRVDLLSREEIGISAGGR